MQRCLKKKATVMKEFLSYMITTTLTQSFWSLDSIWRITIAHRVTERTTIKSTTNAMGCAVYATSSTNNAFLQPSHAKNAIEPSETHSVSQFRKKFDTTELRTVITHCKCCRVIVNLLRGKKNKKLNASVVKCVAKPVMPTCIQPLISANFGPWLLNHFWMACSCT